MQKIANFMYLVMPLVYVAFIWVQVGINQCTQHTIDMQQKEIRILDDALRDACHQCNTNFANCDIALSNLDLCVHQVVAMMTNHVAQETSLDYDMAKRIDQIAKDEADNRATVKVMSGLFCERVKDHATLFEMVGRLSMAVGSLTNVIRFAEMGGVK